MESPQPGDVVYVETELYLWHGVDDFCGGKATVKAVRMETIGGALIPFIEVEQEPGTWHNWHMLAEQQAALAAEFGDAWAHPDPDYRPEFNDDTGGWIDVPTERVHEASPAGGSPTASNRPAVILLWLVAILVFVLDRASKALVMAHLAPNGPPRAIVPHVLWFTYVQNPYGAFGLFGSSPILLIVLALIVLGVFAYAFRDAVKHSMVVRIAFGMIVGGAIGNIVDRLQHRWVVDFIDFRTIWPNVFNVADACITVGVALLVLASLRRERHA